MAFLGPFIDIVLEGAVTAAEGEAAKKAGETVHSVFGGHNLRKRKKPAIVTPDQPSTKKRNINHSSNSTPVHRRFDLASVNTMQQPRNNGEEVEVVPPPSRISKSYADYTTIKLPWFDQGLATRLSTDRDMTRTAIRLNSIFDPVPDFAGVHQPMGRDKFAAFGYKYYRVLSTQVDIEFMNNDQKIAGFTNQNDDIVVGYSLNDDATTTYADYRAFVEAKHAKARILRSTHPIWDGTQRATTMSYTYRPENWDFHVQETGIEERWTPIGSSPPQNHFLIVHTGNTHAHDTTVVFYIHLTFTVQFREIGPITAVDVVQT